MPPIRAAAAMAAALVVDASDAMYAEAFGRISAKLRYIITPAEKPMDKAKKALFVVLLRKAMAEPIPVARPANSVTANAKTIALSTLCLSLGDEKTG
jgi:hypothetical protein